MHEVEETGELGGKGSDTGTDARVLDGVVIVHHQTWLDYTFYSSLELDVASD